MDNTRNLAFMIGIMVMVNVGLVLLTSAMDSYAVPYTPFYNESQGQLSHFINGSLESGTTRFNPENSGIPTEASGTGDGFYEITRASIRWYQQVGFIGQVISQPAMFLITAGLHWGIVVGFYALWVTMFILSVVALFFGR